MKKIIILLLVALITGCNTITKKLYAVKNPKFETYESQKTVLNRKNVDAQNFHYKDLKSYLQASQNRKIEIPNAYFFNRDGNFVSYKRS